VAYLLRQRLQELLEFLERPAAVRDGILDRAVHLCVAETSGPSRGMSAYCALCRGWSSQTVEQVEGVRCLEAVGLKDSVPAKVRRAPGANDLALGPALKDQGLGARAGRVGKGADGRRRLGLEAGEHLVEAYTKGEEEEARSPAVASAADLHRSGPHHFHAPSWPTRVMKSLM
jgi:hypothetical protein